MKIKKFNRWELAAVRAGNRVHAISMFIRRTKVGLAEATGKMNEAIEKYHIVTPQVKVVNTGVDVHQDKDGHLTISVDSDHYSVAMESQSRIIDDMERGYQIITVKPK